MTRANEWAKRVAAWQASGQSAEDFAKGKGYRAKTLQWWSSELRRRARRGASKAQGARKQRSSQRLTSAVRFARVVRTSQSKASSGRVASSEAGVSVRVGKAEIAVRRGFDDVLLAEVVRALEAIR